MSSTQPADVVIIGGGLVGWSAAYHAAQRGLNAIVVDRQDAGYATQAGAGMIAPGSGFHSPPDLLPLAIAAMRHYPTLIAELTVLDAGPTGYATTGSLLVARTDEELAEMPAALRRIETRWRAGLGNIGQPALLTGAEAREFFPLLSDIPAAIHMPEAARVDGRLLRQALKTAAVRMGVRVVDGAASIVVSHHRAQVMADGELLLAESVILAAGAWAGSLGQQCGLTIPVYPQRGQLLHLELPGIETGNWPIVEGFDTHYLLTFAPNRIVAGATREHDAGYDIHPTAGGLQNVLDCALRLAPGLASGNIVEIRVGLRPYSPDLLPLIGRTPGIDNLFICTGHGPSGLTLGPWSGAAVAALAAGAEPEIDLTPFSVARFQERASA